MRTAGAGACLVLGSVLWFVFLISDADGHGWPPASQVAAPNGRPHVIEVRAGREAMMWRFEADAAYPCAVVDGATGTELVPKPTRGWNRRAGGSAGAWVGTDTFRPISGTVILTCERRRGMSGSFVAVETAPRMPWFLIRGTESPDGPFTMFGLGGLLMGAAGLRWLGSYLRR